MDAKCLGNLRNALAVGRAHPSAEISIEGLASLEGSIDRFHQAPW